MPSQRKDSLLPFLTVCTDAVAIEAAFLASYWLRFESPLTALFPVTLGYPPLEAYVIGSLFVIPVWLWLFSRRNLYESRRVWSFADEFFAIVRVIALGMLVVMAAAFFYRAFSFSRLVFGLLFGASIVTVSVGRFALLRFERARYAAGHGIRKVLVAGSGAMAARILEIFRQKPELGYRVVGICAPDGGFPQDTGAGLRAGTIDAVSEAVRDRGVDMVLITLEDEDHSMTEAVVRQCDGLDVDLMLVPDFVELLTRQTRVKEIEGIPFLQLKALALGPLDRFAKRTFDVLAATAILLLIGPVFALIALLVKLTSRGPVFFVQERVGLDGVPFRVLKFRSMRTDAEAATGPVWASKDDPRTTGIGRFLRRFSLDELPQLINVIRGDMSLVGPRPERPHFVEQFRKDVPKYLERHRVKTGMTGWAQVNGLRGNAPIAERTRYDVYYVENWSLVFDLKIILKTIRAVLFGKDAY